MMDTARSQYRQNCARCHGSDYTGSDWRQMGRRIPDFTSRSWQESRMDVELLVSIREGKGVRMPSFGDSLGEEQARNLVRLIRAVNPKRPPTSGVGSSDFEHRFAELQQELNELRKQFRELSASPKKADKSAH